MRFTGTFIDEITHDIPSQNWGPAEWTAEFDVMRQIGIDAVIIIRAGYRDQAIFNSWALRKHRPMLPVRENLAELFLDLAKANGIRVIWGVYDPGDWADNQSHALAINRDFMDEVWTQFGGHEAFEGWYLTFELSRHQPKQVELVKETASFAKQLSGDISIMMSPYIAGPKCPPGDQPISIAEHEHEWDRIFAQIAGYVDVVAFQDGHVDFLDLPSYLTMNARLARTHGIACWSNVETFSRDMPIKFPPIDWRLLEYKMDVAREAGVDKLITFEFSHFMSPFACNRAARNLFNRYCERFHIEVQLPPVTGNGQALPTRPRVD